jgi:hypothetical protein
MRVGLVDAERRSLDFWELECERWGVTKRFWYGLLPHGYSIIGASVCAIVRRVYHSRCRKQVPRDCVPIFLHAMLLVVLSTGLYWYWSLRRRRLWFTSHTGGSPSELTLSHRLGLCQLALNQVLT